MDMIDKAKSLAKHTEGLAATKHWGVDDQDTLEWLIVQAEEHEKLKRVHASVKLLCEQTMAERDELFTKWSKTNQTTEEDTATRCLEIAEACCDPLENYSAEVVRDAIATEFELPKAG